MQSMASTLNGEVYRQNRVHGKRSLSATVTGVVTGTHPSGQPNVAPLPAPQLGSSMQFSAAPSMQRMVQSGNQPCLLLVGRTRNQPPPSMSQNAEDRAPRTLSKTRGSTVDDMVDEAYMQLTTEAGDISRKWRELQLDATHLQRKKLALRSDWAKLRHERAWLEDERRRFNEVILSEVANFDKEPRVKLNVGGITYETYESVLSRDPDSILAALCRDDSPLKDEQKDTEGVVFIDRSGSLFRHILNFLRDGVLPINNITPGTYTERQSISELNSLRTEIEKRLGIVSVAGSATRSIDQSSMRLTHGRPLDNRSRWLAPGTPGGIDSFESAMEGRKWWEKPEGHKGYWPIKIERGKTKWIETSNTYNGKNMDLPLRQYDDFNNTLSHNSPAHNSPKKVTVSTWDSRPSYAASVDVSSSGVLGLGNSSAVSRFRWRKG